MTKISTNRFIEREELNVSKYNELVSESEETSIYSYAWYLDVVSDNWGCLVYGDYELVFPIAYTVKFGQKIIYQPFFTREFSFFGSKNLVKLKGEELLGFLPKEFKKVDFSMSSEYNLMGYNVVEVLNQELLLIDGYESVYKAYSTNTKRLVKKALKASCSIELSTDVDSFTTFFKENTGMQVNYSLENYDRLNALIKTLIKNKTGELYHVKIDGLIVAQGVFIFQNHKITYLKGTTNLIGKKCGAMFLLMNHVIQENKTNAKSFDFGGSKINSIASFYKKFGAKDRVYYQYSKNEHSWVLKKGKMLRDLLKK